MDADIFKNNRLHLKLLDLVRKKQKAIKSDPPIALRQHPPKTGL